MKIWKHTGPGHYIGSTVVVCSDTREAGEKIIRRILDSTGLKDEALNVAEMDIFEGSVIVDHNGEY